MGRLGELKGPSAWLALALLYLVIKSFFGVDFTDEGFYASIPYRFYLGDKPFVDETAIHQTAGFLTFPFVWLFVTISGSTGGLVLFLRILFCILTAFSSLLVYRFVRSHRDSVSAALAACTYVLLTPELSTLSYNSMGVAFLTLALFSSPLWLRGLSAGLMTVAYPPLILITPVLVFIAVYKYPSKTNLTIRFSLFFFLGLTPLLLGLLSAGIPAVIESFRESSAIAPKGGGLDKVLNVFQHLWHIVVTTILTFLVCLAISRYQRPKMREIGLVLFTLILIFRFGPDRIPDLVIALTVFLPAFFMWNWNSRMLHVYFASVFAGGIFAWASTNGGVNFYFGAVPALVVTLAQLPRVNFSLVAGLLVFAGTTNIYRDQPLWNLNTLIRQGPHAGLLTTSAKNDFVISLINSSEAIKQNAAQVIYMNDLPAGFLYTKLRPGICSTWVFTPWNLNQNSFRLKYAKCIRPGVNTAVIYSKLNVRVPSLPPIQYLADPLDELIFSCATENVYEDERLKAVLLNTECVSK